MKSLILRIWYSITTRLVVLFLLIGGCGFILFLTMFRVYVNTSAPDKLLPQPFLTYLSQTFDNIASWSQIESEMDKTVYALKIEQDGQTWQTDESIPSFKQLILVQMKNDHTGLYRSGSNIRYLVIKTATRRYIFGHRFGDSDDGGYRLVVLMIPLLAMLLLMLGYFIAGRFFIPISWIRKGAMRIGEGDLSYRIPYRRKDELGQLVDIVNQMAEDLERIFDSKRQLLLAISHELRSPLTRMKLNVALLDESKVSLRLTDDIDDMRDIVEGLLDSERLQGQHKALDKVEVQPGELITEVAVEFPADAKLTLKPLPRLEPMYLDVHKVKFLLRNILNNAIKYTDNTTRQIQLQAWVDAEQLFISISDNGCGIATEHQDHIFSPFYRADKSRGRQTGGVGLGLYLCLLIAKAHSGDIQVQSELGKGSQFMITLPLIAPIYED